ncbi:MAG: hypothetical protein C4345_12750, partial [Chloroflexota bacterium]
VAIRALRHVIIQSCPPRRPKIAETIGHPLRTPSFQSTCDSPQVRCSVDRIVLGHEGFLVTATLRLTRTALTALSTAGHGGACWTWSGFDRLIDDHGHSYMLRQIETTSCTCRLTGLACTATMSWYPSLGSTVTELQCSCHPARLTGIAANADERPVALPAVFFTDLTCRIALS